MFITILSQYSKETTQMSINRAEKTNWGIHAMGHTPSQKGINY